MEINTHIYVKFDGIAGAAVQKSDEIECLGWSHSFDNSGTINRSKNKLDSIGKAVHGDFNVVKYLDYTTCNLLKECWEGTAIKNVTVSSYRDNRKCLEIMMEDVVITHISMNESTGGCMATESISLNYGKIKFTYLPTDNEDNTQCEISAECNMETSN